ncbi:TonB-dependent receptor [Pseudomarimonas salicorniae]|uniref:TonB-dependent receptor n=1 Tax=Pseudomarimonas salicorniae TaxID=2933270 RepID=A0ABT0GHN6_9GAMM|nr:TonB-dependent receptor [Lysobacter sp. CAU 1642]MCK7594056.1 TonB-dependent receptor [Lysobacter sp. CAU 1642]
MTTARNSSTRRHPLSLAIALAVLVPAAPVLAQQDGAPRNAPTALNEVTVTARKREETLQDVPVAVTAFTAEALDRLDVEDIGDLGAFTPNLTIYAARGSTSTVTAYIRGVGQSDPLWGVDPGVGIYLDDVYIARPQGALLDVFDVERIEVLRGPQGSLYGKNTIGGAIKYISAPLEEDFYGRVSLTAGERSQADVKASLNAPFGNGWVGRFAVASLSRDGYGQNRITGQEVSDKEILAARATLGYVGNDDFYARITADWMDDQSGVRGAQMLAPNRFTPGFAPLDDRYDVRNGMPNINDTSMNGASLTLGWNLGDAWTLKSITAFRESDTETNIDFDLTPLPIADVKAFYSDEQISQELQLNYDNAGDFRGVFGLYWFEGEAGGQVLNNFFGLIFGDTQGQVDTDSIALYGEGTYDFNDQWSVTFGARYTDEKKSADVLNIGYTDATFTRPSGTVAADFEDSVSFENFSPKLSVDYQIDEDTLAYALYSRGFKSGGFNIRAQATAVPRSRLPFDDEKVTSYEVGLKNAFLDNTVFLNLAYFYNDYEDIQLSVFTVVPGSNPPTFFGDFTNAGAGTIQGVEAEYAVQFNEAFAIQGYLAWLDSEYDEFISSGVDVSGSQRFTNAPEFSGSLTGTFTHQLSGGGSLVTRLTYSYQDEVYPTTDLSEAIRQPGYGLLSAGIIWQTPGPWRFALEGTNLADKEYRTTGYNIGALGVLSGFYGAPRQLSVTATYDF